MGRYIDASSGLGLDVGIPSGLPDIPSGDDIMGQAQAYGESAVADARAQGEAYLQQGQDIASGAMDRGRQMASGAMDRGRQMASGAMDRGRQMASGAMDRGRQMASGASLPGVPGVPGAPGARGLVRRRRPGQGEVIDIMPRTPEELAQRAARYAARTQPAPKINLSKYIVGRPDFSKFRAPKPRLELNATTRKILTDPALLAQSKAALAMRSGRASHASTAKQNKTVQYAIYGALGLAVIAGIYLVATND